MELILKHFPSLSETQQAQFAALKNLYADWNEKINVISRKDIDALYEKHVLHSLAIAKVIQFVDGANVVDIGTGGGFPGLPLAILFPGVNFTLIDSIGKKIKVVSEIANSVLLKNVVPIHGRVEHMKGRKFHFAVSRAVAPLGELWKWIKPHLEKGRIQEDFSNGLFCLKGGELGMEIAESGLRPHRWVVDQLLSMATFQDKYVLYVPR